MTAEEYLRAPCAASSLPFWKTERLAVPEGITVLRDDEFRAAGCPGADEPYFRLIHRLRDLPPPVLPAGFEPADCGVEDFAAHIDACYAREGVTPEELFAYTRRPVYDPALWIAVRDSGSGRVAASGIAELDARIGEGALEWVQASPEYRRRGLGRYIVCELLRRLRGRASFVTVSGRLNSPDAPLALYLSCGFEDPVVWHVVTK